MQFVTDYTTERYALNVRWEDFPARVQEWAMMCAIDLTGALILGSYGKQFAAGERLARSMGLSGDIAIVGSPHSYNLLGASIAMGHASNSFDIDDGFRAICGHPGTSFIAGMLASAVQQKLTYKEYLTTLVVCYELTIRWALVMQKEYGFLHSTGTYGAFGTALGIGRNLGLDEKQLNTALSIADYHAPLTPVMRAVEYPSMNKDGVPFGALVGTMAVLEALNGSTGRTHLLEKPEYRSYLDDLGKKYHILDLYFKPYTCCRWAHQPIQACRDLMKEYGFTHREVERVCVHTFRSAALLSKAVPKDTDEAQYNIAFPVASALVHGDVGFLQVYDGALANPDVLSVMERLEFVVEPELDAQFPGKRLAFVDITLQDGRKLSSRVYEAPGEMDDPDLGLPWIRDKFKRITAPMLDSRAQDDLLTTMTNPSVDVRIDELILLINQHLKPLI